MAHNFIFMWSGWQAFFIILRFFSGLFAEDGKVKRPQGRYLTNITRRSPKNSNIKNNAGLPSGRFQNVLCRQSLPFASIHLDN